jgi:hypothetical protein
VVEFARSSIVTIYSYAKHFYRRRCSDVADRRVEWAQFCEGGWILGDCRWQNGRFRDRIFDPGEWEAEGGQSATPPEMDESDAQDRTQRTEPAQIDARIDAFRREIRRLARRTQAYDALELALPLAFLALWVTGRIGISWFWLLAGIEFLLFMALGHFALPLWTNRVYYEGGIAGLSEADREEMFYRLNRSWRSQKSGRRSKIEKWLFLEVFRR